MKKRCCGWQDGTKGYPRPDLKSLPFSSVCAHQVAEEWSPCKNGAKRIVLRCQICNRVFGAVAITRSNLYWEEEAMRGDLAEMEKVALQ